MLGNLTGAIRIPELHGKPLQAGCATPLEMQKEWRGKWIAVAPQWISGLHSYQCPFIEVIMQVAKRRQRYDMAIFTSTPENQDVSISEGVLQYQSVSINAVAAPSTGCSTEKPQCICGASWPHADSWVDVPSTGNWAKDSMAQNGQGNINNIREPYAWEHGLNVCTKA